MKEGLGGGKRGDKMGERSRKGVEVSGGGGRGPKIGSFNGYIR